jgi:hypothetical protein
LVLAATPVVLVGATAVAQYPPGLGTLVLSPTTVTTGGTFTATLTGCTTGDVIGFSLVSDGDTATCASVASVTLTAPATPGTYTVFASVADESVTATLTVVGIDEDENLPDAGSDSLPIVRIGTGLLLAGLGLVGVAWYRRRSSVTG